MAIRNFAPRYVNTCIYFDLEAAAKAGGRLFCPQCERVMEWDDRQGVLCNPVSDHQRQVRRMIVVQLHEDKKAKASQEEPPK
jgi:hypothetical protein